MIICQPCQNILTRVIEASSKSSGDLGYEDLAEEREFAHHENTQSLRNSIKAKCFICTIFWSTISPDMQKPLAERNFQMPCGRANHEIHESRVTLMAIQVSEATNEVQFHIMLVWEGWIKLGWKEYTPPKPTSFRVLAAKQGDIEFELLLKHHDVPRLSSSTRSSETMSLAKGWIEDCLQVHIECNRHRDQTWYPTRLLDSGPLNAPDDQRVHLVETKVVNPSGPYMTLSHSWGKRRSLVLNKASYQQLLDGMLISSLPQTFGDAVVAARLLGVRYMWIDAMCIFQDADNLSDWVTESLQMHKVYSNSYCNIVAGETQDSSGSIFNERNHDEIVPPFALFTITNKDLDHDNTTKYIVVDDCFWDQVRHAPINSRGWVLQERYLSPRGLHFGFQQLFWECREKDAAEIIPEGLEVVQSGPPFKSTYATPRARIRIDSDDEYWDFRHDNEFWRNTVIRYSACALTYATDRLIAFSAIAKQMCGALNDQYVAGMSHNRLQTDMMWRSTSTGPRGQSYSGPYIAPSWSWASFIGAPTFIPDTRKTDEILFRVEKYELDYVTEDKTGPLRGGWIRLSGWLKRLKFLIQDEKRKQMDVVINGLEVQRPHRPWGGEIIYLEVKEESWKQENKNGELYCMPARKCQVAGIFQFEALVFKLVDADKRLFRRIGLLVLDDTVDGLVVMSIASDESTFPCDKYEDGRHIITVI